MLLYFSGFQNVNHRAHRPKLTEGKALENNGVFVINLWDWIAMLVYYFNCDHFSLAFCFSLSLSLIPVIFTIEMRRTNSNRNSPLVLYNTNPYQKESCTIFLFFLSLIHYPILIALIYMLRCIIYSICSERKKFSRKIRRSSLFRWIKLNPQYTHTAYRM